MCGQFTGLIKHDSKEVEEEIFLGTELKIALIGHPAIETLNLVSGVRSIDDLTQKHATQYPNLFQGLRTFEGEYYIPLQEDAKPFAFTTLRRVALSSLWKVETELKQMEDLEVISFVHAGGSQV